MALAMGIRHNALLPSAVHCMGLVTYVQHGIRYICDARRLLILGCMYILLQYLQVRTAHLPAEQQKNDVPQSGHAASEPSQQGLCLQIHVVKRNPLLFILFPPIAVSHYLSAHARSIQKRCTNALPH